ncbi:hypothetical protein [Quadrisphaera sp. KR29]|uniref:hypothetical protein n=1 Tax=Quadrisphaera sp. KR29 TaxID=3461391 RepID=UPI004043BAFF
MAVIALTSASGAPGVTATALGLTLVWPRPALLVEADPSHGSSVLAGYLRGAVPPGGASLLGLVKAHRVGRLAQAIDEQTVSLDDERRHRLIPALPAPEQAPVLDSVWDALAEVFTDLDDQGVDVIVDAGRLGTAHGPGQLLRAADVCALVTRTQLPAVAAAHARVRSLAELTNSVGGRSAHLIVIGDGRPYTGAEIAEVTGLPVLAPIAWDPVGADVLSFGAMRPRRWEQSRFVRDLVGAADVIARRVEERRAPVAAGVATARGRWARA